MVRIISNMRGFLSFSDKCDKIYGFNNNSNNSSCMQVCIFNANITKENYLVYTEYSPQNFVE
jgi:hypothetical protein